MKKSMSGSFDMATGIFNTLSNVMKSDPLKVKQTGGDPLALITGKPAGDALGILTKPDINVPPQPVVKPPVAMPDQDAIDADKKRSLADQLARRGRASTILTDQNDKLGG
jgi:hypothetical protein